MKCRVSWPHWTIWTPILLLAGSFSGVARAQEQAARRSSTDHAVVNRFVDQYCIECHNGEAKKGGLDLDAIGAEDVGRHPEVWEKVVRKLVARQMPPAKKPRPEEAAYDSVVSALVGALDGAAAAASRPRQDRHVPAAQPDRISERHPRPAGAGGRCRGAAARRRVEPWVRQRDGGRPLADAPGPLHHGGAEDQPAGGREPLAIARRRHDPDPRGPHPGGTRRRAPDRDARRGADPLSLPAGRRVRDPAPAGARPQRARRGPGTSRTSWRCCSIASGWRCSP